jgi:hypothetical protein
MQNAKTEWWSDRRESSAFPTPPSEQKSIKYGRLYLCTYMFTHRELDMIPIKFPENIRFWNPNRLTKEAHILLPTLLNLSTK